MSVAQFREETKDDEVPDAALGTPMAAVDKEPVASASGDNVGDKKDGGTKEEKEEKEDEKEVAVEAAEKKDGEDAGAGNELKGVGARSVASSVQNLVKKSGGAVAAMKKYIASFSGESQDCKLGSGPPCRSYRNLLVLSEYDELEKRLVAAKSKDDLATALAFYKPFKAAYSELITMAKGAATRLTVSVEKMTEVAAEETASVARSQGRRKKDKAGAQAKHSIWEAFGTFGKEVPSHVLTDASKPAPATLVSPIIVRLDPKSAELGAEGAIPKMCDVFADRFAKSEQRAEPGRAQRKVARVVWANTPITIGSCAHAS